MQEYNMQPEENNEPLKCLLESDTSVLNKLLASLKQEQAKLLHEQLTKLLNNQPRHSHACMLLGMMYIKGLGVEKDFMKAIELSEQAIKLDNSTAMVNRAWMHCDGQGGPVDNLAALKLFERAIDLGHSCAMLARARMHEKGQGGPVDYLSAIDLYERAIGLNNSRAMNNRAGMHMLGNGGPVNYPAAIALLERAIALGHSSAMRNRAMMHYNGRGGPVNYLAAIVLFERAIDLGDSSAMNIRAKMHRQGQGGPINDLAAIVLYDQAIDLGYSRAMNLRAMMHEEGQGGPVDYPAAIALLERAIALNDSSALKNRANMHLKGYGESNSQSNPIAAAKLLRQGAHAGFISPADLEKFNPALTSSLELKYFYKSAMCYLKPNVSDNASSAFLVFIANDDSLSQDNKITYSRRMWPACEKLLDDLQDEHEIEALAQLQILIAKQILHQSSDLDEDNAAAEDALKLAENAREKLHSIPTALAHKLHHKLREQLILTLCEFRLPVAQTDAVCLADTITDLLSCPTSSRANLMLIELLLLAQLEPYFSQKEKYRLLLILASRADPSGKDFSVQRLAAQAHSALSTNQFLTVSNSTHFITFDHLVGLATNIMLEQQEITKDVAALKNLQLLLQQSTRYAATPEEALLLHPWVQEALEYPCKTYENMITQSLTSEEKSMPLPTLQHELLERLNDLSHYYRLHPEKMSSSMLTKEQSHAHSSRFFQPSSNNSNSNNNTTSIEVNEARQETLNFAEFRKQKRIEENLLKNHTPS